MTVAEFIAELKKFPKDVQIVYGYQSGYEILNAGDAKLVKAEDKKIIIRNDGYMDCDERWVEKGCDPEWVTVVTLPGN